MAATDNNLLVPDDLLDQARRVAQAEGCTADELAADTLKRYIENRQSAQGLRDLASWGNVTRENAFKPSDVDRAIPDLRLGR